MDWARSADRLSATGIYSGIRAILRPEGWFLMDQRKAADGQPPIKPRAFGPFSSDGAARAAAEAKFERSKP